MLSEACHAVCAVISCAMLCLTSYLHVVKSLYLTLPDHGVVDAQNIVFRLAASRQSTSEKVK